MCFSFFLEDMNEDYGETGPVSNAIRSGFLQLDESMRQLPEVMAGQDRSGWMDIKDKLFFEFSIDWSGIHVKFVVHHSHVNIIFIGSTAICCLVTKKHLYFANCGDSRAVLCRGGKVTLCTHDHKPANPGERDRIQKAGGSVMIQRVSNNSEQILSFPVFFFLIWKYFYTSPSDDFHMECIQLIHSRSEVTMNILLMSAGKWELGSLSSTRRLWIQGE